MRKKIAFRVDGGPSLGMGNVIRSLALADALKSKGFSTSFLMQEDIHALETVREKKYLTKVLAPPSVPEDPGHESLAQTTRKWLLEENISILIQDVKDTSKEDALLLKEQGVFLIHFDDLGSGRDIADVLFDGFYFDSPSLPSQHRYFGPDHLILRKEFLEASKAPTMIHENVSRILVLLGGSNAGGMLKPVLKTLENLPKSMSCDIVLGRGVPQKEVLKENYAGERFFFHVQPESLPSLCLKADLAITSGGMSMGEMCSLGLPTLVMPQVPHEQKNALFYEKQGAVVRVSSDLGILIQEISNNVEKRKKLSLNAKRVVDGKGLQRVVQILSEVL